MSGGVFSHLVTASAVIICSIFVFSSPIFAYVSVDGYFKSNGTWVNGYVRSDPNGLKYDNYGWTPDQGLYNPSYYSSNVTHSSDWYTPSWVWDTSYDSGKLLYDTYGGGSNYSSYSSYIPTYDYSSDYSSYDTSTPSTSGYDWSNWSFPTYNYSVPSYDTNSSDSNTYDYGSSLGTADYTPSYNSGSSYDYSSDYDSYSDWGP